MFDRDEIDSQVTADNDNDDGLLEMSKLAPKWQYCHFRSSLAVAVAMEHFCRVRHGQSPAIWRRNFDAFWQLNVRIIHQTPTNAVLCDIGSQTWTDFRNYFTLALAINCRRSGNRFRHVSCVARSPLPRYRAKF